jgi:fluoroquinolone transport system permease protein
MLTLNQLRSLSRIDALSIRRDSLLRGMIVVPLGLALAARWVLPGLVEQIGILLGLDLLGYYPSFIGYVLLLLPPTIGGMVIGFLVLDQRDDQTLLALRVTPLPLSGYLVYRLSLPMLLSLLMTLVAFPIAGVIAIGWLGLLGAALLAAPLAPLTALCLAVFAANKVQGFALQKVLSVPMLAPIAAAFVPEPWRWGFALLPTTWPAAFFWQLQSSGIAHWWLFPLGIAYQGLLVWWLARRLGRNYEV